MQKVDTVLDLRGLPCPENLPKLLIKLETMNRGELLELIVDDIVALDRIPLALEEESDYKIIDCNIDMKPNIHIFIKII